MSKEQDRFKSDYLVDYVRRKHDIYQVSDIVRKISSLIQKAQFQYPKHVPLDAAYAMVRDAEEGMQYA